MTLSKEPGRRKRNMGLTGGGSASVRGRDWACVCVGAVWVGTGGFCEVLEEEDDNLSVVVF